MNELIEQPTKRERRKGHYQISTRLQKALLALVSGEARSQAQAATLSGLGVRALQLSLRKPHVRAFLQQEVMSALGLSAARAARRMDELLTSPNEMVGFRASAWALGAGLHVAPPPQPSTTVNIGIGGDLRPGFVIDLREPNEPGALIHPFADGGAPMIEGEATELGDEAK